jgi:autotransporter-associated beta strand protein
MFGNVVLGDWWGSSNGVSATGTFKMAAGTVDANATTLGKVEGANTSASTVAAGTIEMSGGSYKSTTLTLADQTTGQATPQGTFNLHNGTLSATTVAKGAGAGTAAINWDAGTIQNIAGGNLSVGGAVTITLYASGELDFNVTSNQTATVGNSAAITGGGALSKVGAGSLVLSSNNTYTGGTNVSAGTLITATNFSNGPISITGGTAKVAQQTSGNNLSANVTIVPSVTVSGGKLDLTNNGMIVDYSGSSSIGAIQTSLKSGYAGGAWNGNGIISSTAASNVHGAIGYGEASTLGSPSTFLGVNVPDDTAVLMRYTLGGDANLDGVVNTDDFNALALNFNASGKLWTDGDANYDGIVNALDFNQLATNFGATLDVPVGPAPALGTLVPEPCGIVALVAPMLMVRRRRK